MVHHFILESSLPPADCRRILHAAISGKQEPCGLLKGSWFRVKQAEYFSRGGDTVIRYAVYGRIREGRDNRAEISCTRFESAADPFWWAPIFLLVFLGLTFAPFAPGPEKLLSNFINSLLIAMGYIAVISFANFLVRKQTGERLPSGLDAFLCETLHARKTKG